MNKIKNPYFIENKLKASIGISIIIVGIMFISSGNTVLEIAKLFAEDELIERIEEERDIDYRDSADQVTWINEFSISQTDNDPKIVGNTLGLNGYIELRKKPVEVALNVFHEDADTYFTSTEEFYYRDISENLERVPSLKYGDIYYIKFNIDDLKSNKETFGINGFSNIEFSKQGTYYAQVSVKLEDNTILHYHSNTSVFTIKDRQHDWMINALEVLVESEEKNKPLTISAFGWTVIAIGIGLIVSGISLFVSGIEVKPSLIEQLRRGY